jgi:MFS family permease
MACLESPSTPALEEWPLTLPLNPPALSAPANERWILAAVILGSGMAFIDGTAVNTALPVMQRSLNVDLTTMQWVVEGYLLSLSALLLVGGALGDRWGRRRVFILGTILFALTSLGCAFAPNTAVLVSARLLQGAAGALLVPSSLAVITASFDSTRRGAA